MKRKVLVVALITVALASLLVACNSSTSYDGMTKIVYELEGGSYMNCDLPVLQYYDFKSGTSNLIYDPTVLSQEAVQREGYKFTGWFKTKTVDGNDVTYSDKWNFESDKVGTEGVTLYAGWELKVKYAYNVCYVDDNGNTKVLGTYSVKAGEEFNDRKKFANKRTGYTAYVHQNGKLLNGGYYLDPEFTKPAEGYKHPGGNESLTINVYAKYIKGEYTIVRSASELTLAKSSNIYLDADIDMGGKVLSFATYSKKTFEGNGHTVSNFKLAYNLSDASLEANFDNGSQNAVYVCLFKEIANSTIQNVNFKGVQLVIEGEFSKAQYVYVAPLCMSATGATVKNVTFELTYQIVGLPIGESTTFELSRDGYRQKDEASNFEGFDITINEIK